MDLAQNKLAENKRVEALFSLDILETPSEERFDQITRFATEFFKLPISGISLIDHSKEWFKSSQGIPVKQISRRESLSSEALFSKGVFVVSDTKADERYSHSSLVINEPQIRSFAGRALTTLDNYRVGVFFIADKNPREFTQEEINQLESIAGWANYELTSKQFQKVCDLSAIKDVREQLTLRNRELEEEKARHDAMLQNIGDGVMGINDKGEIIFSNKQVEIMTGWAESEILGKPLIHVLRLEDEEKVEVSTNNRPIRTALFAKKKVISDDYFYVKKDKSRFPVAITATPVVLHGQVVGGVNVFRDVTREKEIDRMKTEFISLASHQLRTPLSAMKWFTEMLVDGDIGKLNAEQFEVVNNIYQSNERMIGLVNALLNISRIESGRIIIEPKPTDLEKLVREVVTELNQKIEKKKIHLAVSVSDSLPNINIDPKLVRHVYMNLLTNAIKYSREGGEVTVIISKSGNEVISQVSDYGFGIPKNQQDQVFKKFFRAENVAKVETDGTGLGLYLTKAIVDSSGGKIWFESEEDKGTTFWFILPLTGSHQKEGEVSLDT